MKTRFLKKVVFNRAPAEWRVRKLSWTSVYLLIQNGEIIAEIYRKRLADDNLLRKVLSAESLKFNTRYLSQYCDRGPVKGETTIPVNIHCGEGYRSLLVVD